MRKEKKQAHCMSKGRICHQKTRRKKRVTNERKGKWFVNKSRRGQRRMKSIAPNEIRKR